MVGLDLQIPAKAAAVATGVRLEFGIQDQFDTSKQTYLLSGTGTYNTSLFSTYDRNSKLPV